MVRIVIYRRGLEQSHTMTVAVPEYRELLGKVLLLPSNRSYNLRLS